MQSAQRHHITQQNDTGTENLTPAQLKVLGLLASGKPISKVAEAAGVDRSTIYRWLRDDAAFVAEFNRQKEESLSSIQAELRAMAREAVAVLREILQDKTTPASVRLRTALAVLESAGGIQIPEVGDTDAGEIQRVWTLKREQQVAELHRTLHV